MKNKILIFVFLLIQINTFGQTWQDKTIYTPNGTAVYSDELISGDYTSQQKEDAKNYWLNYYNNRITFINEATYSYNCHGYAWAKSKGGATVWINTPEEDKYWNDDSYLEVTNENAASTVSFRNEDHSAITTNQQGYFISKWGPSPLFKHVINDCPYNSGNLRYYVRPNISGTNTVCFSNRTFTLHNRPSGSAVTWTKSSNLIYISGQGTDNYTVRARGNGNGWVQANINGATFRKTFWVGKPSQPTTNPSGYPTIKMALNERKTFFASSNGSPSSYHWWISGSSVDIISGSNSYRCVMYGDNLGWSNFYVNSTNQCGTSSNGGGSINVTSSGGGLPVPKSIIIYPNPTKNILNVEFQTSDNEINNNLETKEIFLYTKMMKLVKYKKITGNTFTMNLSNLKADVYMIKIIIGNDIYDEKIIVTE